MTELTENEVYNLTHDSVTGLLNDAAFEEDVQRFASRVYYFNANADYLKEKYNNKPESGFISFKQIMQASEETKEVLRIRSEAEKYKKYLAYTDTGYEYSKNNIDMQLFNLQLSLEKTISLLNDALKLQEAGCFAIVLEMVPEETAKYVTENISIPTIGIGAGVNCSGQIVVTDDILGKFTDFTPKFIKKFANLHDTVLYGVEAYKKEVKSKIFPSENESFELNKEEKVKLSLT